MQQSSQSQIPRALVTFDSDLLVFVDETGEERLNRKFPIFGVGGVMVFGSQYHREIELPWAEIRKSIGLAPDVPLHAATDFEKYKCCLDSIADLFSSGQFVRHAALVTDQTIHDQDPFTIAAVNGLARNVGRVLARTYLTDQINRIVYVIEHSERLQPRFEKAVGSQMTLARSDGKRFTFPQVWALIKKTACEPGLEISDFVMHAAFGHVRTQLRNPRKEPRRDFYSVFRSVPEHYVEYMEVNTSQVTNTDGPPGIIRIGLG